MPSTVLPIPYRAGNRRRNATRHARFIAALTTSSATRSASVASSSGPTSERHGPRTSGSPTTLVAATATNERIASSTTIGSHSESDGTTRTSRLATWRSPCGTGSTSATRRPEPGDRDSASAASRMEPEPTMTAATGRRPTRAAAHAPRMFSLYRCVCTTSAPNRRVIAEIDRARSVKPWRHSGIKSTDTPASTRVLARTPWLRSTTRTSHPGRDAISRTTGSRTPRPPPTGHRMRRARPSYGAARASIRRRCRRLRNSGRPRAPLERWARGSPAGDLAPARLARANVLGLPPGVRARGRATSTLAPLLPLLRQVRRLRRRDGGRGPSSRG